MTIYALSTGPGIAGIAVIRISGHETKFVIENLIKKDSIEDGGEGAFYIFLKKNNLLKKI